MPGAEIFQRANLFELSKNPPNLIFSNAVEFSEFIETLAVRDQTTLTSAIVDYCEVYDLEYESLSKMLTSSIKEKIISEMQDLGLIAKSNRLEFE